MPYMGITLATIFTMLRLADEAKMRQVICGGKWVLGPPVRPVSAPEEGLGKLVEGWVEQEMGCSFLPKRWPKRLRRGASDRLSGGRGGHRWLNSGVCFQGTGLSGRESALCLSLGGSVSSISGGVQGRTMGFTGEGPGKMALWWACPVRPKTGFSQLAEAIWVACWFQKCVVCVRPPGGGGLGRPGPAPAPLGSLLPPPLQPWRPSVRRCSFT